MAPKKWAVLVGIDFYVRSVDRLKGCVYEVELLKEYFDSYHQPISITTFTATDASETDPNQAVPTEEPLSWPTFENITEFLKKIADEANRGDFVFFHFSGHGVLKSAMSRDYKNCYGSDVALALFDSSSIGTHYLRGIELAYLFETIVKKDVRLTVTLDCCFSGSISRGGEANIEGIRSVPWNDSVALAFPPVIQPSGEFLNHLSGVNRGARTHEHRLLRPETYALLAACGPDEVAIWECCKDHGHIHGAFTCCLIGAFCQATKDGYQISMQLLYAEMCAKLRNRPKSQRPVLLGCLDTLFLPSATGRRLDLPSYNVIKIDTRSIWLNAGSLHGICINDQFLICSTSTLATTAGTLAATDPPLNADKVQVRIKTVYDFESEADWVGAARSQRDLAPRNSNDSMIGWHANIIHRAGSRATVQLCDGFNSLWMDIISKSEWVEVVRDTPDKPQATELAIQVSLDNTNIIFKEHQKDIRYLPTIRVSELRAAYSTLTVLEHLAKFRHFRGLQNHSFNFVPADSFNITVEPLDHSTTISSDGVIATKHLGTFRITVTNNTDKPIFVSIYNLAPPWRISKVFPQNIIGMLYLPGKEPIGNSEQKVLCPRSKRIRMTMDVPPCLQDSNGVEIEDVFKIIITTESVSFPKDVLGNLDEERLDSTRGRADMVSEFFHELSLLDDCNKLRGEAHVSCGKWVCRDITVRTTFTGSGHDQSPIVS